MIIKRYKLSAYNKNYIMKTIYKMFLIVLFSIIICSSFRVSVYAGCGGACSGHGGVDCDAGSDDDGSVVCNDGWRNSSVMFDECSKCRISYKGKSRSNHSSKSNTNSSNISKDIPKEKNNNDGTWLLLLGIPVGIYAVSSVSEKNKRQVAIPDNRTRSSSNMETNSKVCPICGSPMYKRYTSTGIVLYCRKTKRCGYIRRI